MDLFANDDAVQLRADLPGVAADGLTIEVDRGVLHIDGERSGGLRFIGALGLSEGVDPEGITAGLAEKGRPLTLPGLEAHTPRRIPMTTSDG